MRLVSVVSLAWMLFATSLVQGFGTEPVPPGTEWAGGGPLPSLSEFGRGHFTENLGQWDTSIMFAAQGGAGQATFGLDGAVYTIGNGGAHNRIKVGFLSTAPVRPRASGDIGYPTSFFLGDDPSRWVSGARSYRELLYEDVWPAIDVRYYFKGGDLKYDVVLGPDAVPSSVRFRVEGQEGLLADGDRLDIRLPGGPVVQDRGLVARYGDGEPVEVHFAVDARSGEYGFAVEKRPGRELVIDPTVVLSSTFLGGTYDEYAEDLAVGPDGDVYVTGTTGSIDFPTTEGAVMEDYLGNDIVVTRMNHNGSSILSSTFIGGSGYDFVAGLDIDSDGAVYVSGTTYSTDFPMCSAYQLSINRGMNTYQPDLFVLKMNANCTALHYSTYVGGSGPEDGGEVKVRDGCACVVGRTDSRDFPTKDGYYASTHGDGLLFIMSEAGDRITSTQFWGGYGADWATSLVVDQDGDLVVGGVTTSYDFQVTPGVYKEDLPAYPAGFVCRLSPDDGVVLLCTYVCGMVDALALDDESNIYFVGSTVNIPNGVKYPTTPGAFDTFYNGRTEGFVSKLDADGTELLYSTYLGGDADDHLNGIAVDDEGRAVVVGSVVSGGNFTVTDGCADAVSEGPEEGFVFVLNSTGTEPTYSTFLGGRFYDAVSAVAITPDDNIVVAGSTNSADFPTTEDAVQGTVAGNVDMFVTVIGALYPPSAPVNLTATGGEGHIVVGWERPLQDFGFPVRQYLLLRGTSEDGLLLLHTLGNGTLFVDSGVEWGVTYCYAVIADNGKGRSPQSNVAWAMSVTVPDAPRNLTGTALRTHILLEWEPPAFTGGPPLVGYRLCRGTTGASIEHLATVPSDIRFYTDLQLVDRTTYVYELAAVNAFGESRDRSRVTVRATGAPSPPLDPSHTYGDLFINLTWEVPEDVYGLPVTAYNVYRQSPDGQSVLVGTVDSMSLSLVDTDIEVGVTYVYRVSALNDKGESETSAEVLARAMVRPSPPEGARAASGEHFVRVSWQPPAFDGCSPVLGYKVHLHEAAAEPVLLGYVNVEGQDAPALTFLHDVPYDGVPRSYHVTAVNAEGESDPSATATTEPLEAPSAPRDLAVVRGDGRLALGWLAPASDGGAAVSSYTVYRRAGPGGELVELVTLPAIIGHYVDDTTVNGVLYGYSVTARNLAGESVPTPVVEAVPAGRPLAPEGLAAVGLDGSVGLSWDAPGSDGGSAIAGYRVYRRSDGASGELMAEVGPGARALKVTGLENGKAYLFAVSAFTDAGESDPCRAVEVTPVGPPSAPRGLVAVWADGCVRLTWSAPTSSGGLPVAGYRLHRDDRALGDWTVLGALDLYFTDAEVVGGKKYNYTLQAFNEAGLGPAVTATLTVPMPKERPPRASETGPWPLLVIGLVLAMVALVLLAMRKRPRVEER